MTTWSKIRDRNHPFWKWYEITTAVIGWTAIPTMLLVLWNSVGSAFGWPTLLTDHAVWLWGYMAAAMVWIIKADKVKYRITRDPRDELGRKWFSWKHAQQFRPGERIFVEQEGELKPGSLIAICRTCGQVHGYPADRVGTRQVCQIYGCTAEIDLGDPANYSIKQ